MTTRPPIPTVITTAPTPISPTAATFPPTRFPNDEGGNAVPTPKRQSLEDPLSNTSPERPSTEVGRETTHEPEPPEDIVRPPYSRSDLADHVICTAARYTCAIPTGRHVWPATALRQRSRYRPLCPGCAEHHSPPLGRYQCSHVHLPLSSG